MNPLHSSTAPLVGVVMGSDSDWRVMSDASQVLTDFSVAHEVEVVSAPRTPDELEWPVAHCFEPVAALRAAGWTRATPRKETRPNAPLMKLTIIAT